MGLGSFLSMSDSELGNYIRAPQIEKPYTLDNNNFLDE